MTVSKKFNKTSNEYRLTFKVSKEAAQGAKQVFLLCEYNGWDPIEMELLKSGDFKYDLKVKVEEKTEYQYRFRLVMEDGQEKYDNDWNADRYVTNPFGGENSLVDLNVGLSDGQSDEAEAASAPAPAAAPAKEKAPAKTTKTAAAPAKEKAPAAKKPTAGRKTSSKK